jgi:hypothetical protein
MFDGELALDKEVITVRHNGRFMNNAGYNRGALQNLLDSEAL